MSLVDNTGQDIAVKKFSGIRDLEEKDKEVFTKIRENVFQSDDETLSMYMGSAKGTIVYGDLEFPQTDDDGPCSFEDFLELLVEVGRWTIFIRYQSQSKILL